MWTTDKDTSNTINADDLHALMASKLAVKRDSKTLVVRGTNGESLVTSREALEGISRFLSDVGGWCDQDGSFDTDSISISRAMVGEIRGCIDTVIDADGGAVAIDAGCKSMYEQLSKRRKMIFDKHRKETHDD